MPRTHTPARLGLVSVIAALVPACGTTPATPERTGEEPVPVIIDTDVDVSDVAALAVLLLDPRLDVRAVTIASTGTGVTSCASGRAVIRYVLEELGRPEIPYACGRSDPGVDAMPFPPEWRSAADVGWGIDMPPRPQTERPERAVDLLIRSVADSESPPTIVALGPWTNLEDAIAADATFAERIAGIHAMAGTIDAPGNVLVDGLTPDDRLEWNVAADPSAFVSVFETGVPLSLVPLDATDDVPVQVSLIDRLAEGASAGTNLVYELFVRVPARVGDGQQLWDELAALAVGEQDLVTWEDMDLVVQPHGRLIRDPAGRPVRVAMAANASETAAALLASLERDPLRATRFELRGELAASWDGTTCAAAPVDSLAPGMSRLTLDNTSGEPASVSIIGIDASRRWTDVEQLLRDLDPEATEQPDWITLAGTVADGTGDAGSVSSPLMIAIGTYGPICVAGTWPEVTFTAGAPFEVDGAR